MDAQPRAIPKQYLRPRPRAVDEEKTVAIESKLSHHDPVETVSGAAATGAPPLTTLG